MRVLGKSFITATLLAMAVPVSAEPAQSQQKYGPPEHDAPAPPPARNGRRLPLHSHRLQPLENKYPEQRLAETEEIMEGVWGTLKPVRATITVPFGPRR